MSLADRIANERNKSANPRCRFGRLEYELSDDDWAVVLASVAEIRETRELATARGRETVNQASGLSASALSRALRAEGYDISKDVVQAHAYWHCRCGF